MVISNKQSTAYIICGFIGAGKTTFAKKLEKETGAVRITKDEWSIHLIGNDPTIDGYAEWDHKICDLTRNFACQLTEKGVDVIIDEGFWEKDQRQEIRKRMEKAGAKVILYYLNFPMEVMRKRVVGRNNNLSSDSFEISAQLFDSYAKLWEPLGADEEYILAS